MLRKKIEYYNIDVFIRHLIAINSIVFSPWCLGFFLMSIRTSGLGELLLLIGCIILIILFIPLFPFTLAKEIYLFIKVTKNYKKDNWFYHFFSLHVFTHALFIGLLIFFSLFDDMILGIYKSLFTYITKIILWLV